MTLVLKSTFRSRQKKAEVHSCLQTEKTVGSLLQGGNDFCEILRAIFFFATAATDWMFSRRYNIFITRL